MILVLVETEPESGLATEVTLETVAFARSLAEAGGGITIRAVVVGAVADRDALAAELGSHGVAEVVHAVGDAFDAYGGACWAAAVQAVQVETESVVVTAAGTPRGMEVLAHLAARLDVPMAANVVSFSGLAPFTVARQVVGGAAYEDMTWEGRPAVFTVAGHSWVAEPVGGAAAAWREVEPEVSEADLVARVVSVGTKAPDESKSLAAASVVVGAGRGAGSADGFGGVEELAGLLGGVVGVSRVVTSLGWRPHHEQVGQTGSRIAPDLYIPCGISGAIQHWAGCASSKVIVAVNTDAEAPMMTRATYAVVGDMHEVLPGGQRGDPPPPRLTQRLRDSCTVTEDRDTAGPPHPPRRTAVSRRTSSASAISGCSALPRRMLVATRRTGAWSPVRATRAISSSVGSRASRGTSATPRPAATSWAPVSHSTIWWTWRGVKPAW